MAKTAVFDPERERSRVPASALALSVAILAVPVAALLWYPEWIANGLGMLVWLAALIPAFLLAYYRGLRGVAVAVVLGMILLIAAQVAVVAFGFAEPHWTLLLAMVGAYLVVALGIGGLAEALLKERRHAQDLALLDALTGLPNRRHFEIVLASAFASAERGRRLSLVMFDLDEFKLVNDRRGHLAGDRTMQAFAGILRANTRLQDLSARYGGEEFVTVLPDAGRGDAEVFAARVLDQLRAWPLPWGHQTVSAGVAAYEAGMGSYEILIGAADLALYRAKESGRDCICVAPATGEMVPHPVRIVAPTTSTTPDTRGTLAAARATIRVWVVDDSAFVRSALKSMLARGGYESWVTANPFDAIRRFARQTPEERPDVIIADVIMPEMSGPRMVGEIVKLSPHVRVIYMSGFVQSAISWGGTPGTDVAFLEKPITMGGLSTALTKVLAGDDMGGSTAA